MATTTTFHTLSTRLVRELWAGRPTLVVPFASLGASTATSLVIASSAYSSSDVNYYDGVGVYMTCANAAATAPEGEFGGRVTRGGFTVATGTFAISGGFTADPNISVTNAPNLLFLYGLRPEELLEAVNNIQRNLYLPRYLLPTLVTDGDFEASGEGDWPDVVGTPVQTKETSIVLVGRQSLKIVTTTLGHAVQGDSIPVTEGEQMIYSTAIKCTAGSIVASMWDVTNSVAIDSVTVDEVAWTEGRFQFTVPSGCQNVAPRYASGTASTTAYIGWSSLLSQDRKIIDLPSQIEDANYIEGIYTLPQGRPSVVSKSYIAFSERLQPHSMGKELRDWRAVNAQRIEVGRIGFDPLVIRFRGKGSAFTGIAATTSEVTECPEEIIVQGALANLKKRIAAKTRNTANRNKLLQEAFDHLRTYNVMLDGTSLLRPMPKMQTQNRVRVS